MAAGLTGDLNAYYAQLLVDDVRSRLPGTALEDAPVPSISISAMRQLLSESARLALSDDHAERTVAYEIASRVSRLRGNEYPGFVQAAEVILARLGNFPGKDLLRNRFNAANLNVARLQLEMRMQELENTIIDAGGRKRILTDFQFEALGTFSRNKGVSVSAPTSAGKSFLLALQILQNLKDQRPASIVYLVPTRALIRQVVIDLRTTLRTANLGVPLVRSMPRIVRPEEAPDGIVYVLTQERLLSLLNPEEGKPWLTSLMVDEAQGIRDGARGVLLHTAIEMALTRFPGIDLIFASPLARNPEYLLDVFSVPDGATQQEQHSPVSQNVILVDSVEEFPRRIRCTLVDDDQRLALGLREINSRFRGLSSLRRLALFARSVVDPRDPTDCCIVYANGARDAERIAHHLTRGMQSLNPLDSEIEDFIAFIAEHIHPRYGLAEVLKYGVGFHYGNMPGSVRAGVEELFQHRKLQFLACTSTLLQGVNLPAHHIVIESPTRGRNQPMERSDFVNLAGRAGRLTKEFHGNVWCLRPDRWEIPAFTGDRLHEIRSAFDLILSNDGGDILEAFDEDYNMSDRSVAVAALGRIFNEYVQKDRSLEVPDDSDSINTASLREVVDVLENFRSAAQLPADIFARNSGVHPRRLEALYAHLSAQSELDSFFPIRPNTKNTNHRLREIFQRVQRFLGGISNNSYKYHAKIAAGWIHENPLRRIIANELAFREAEAARADPPQTVNVRNLIYSVIDTIEREIRFRYVKYIRAYFDVLSQVFRDRNESDKIADLPPFHLYLECGAFRPVSLSLISLGLSRVSALVLSKSIVLPADASPEECLRRCIQAISNAPRLRLPKPVRAEIVALTGQIT